jgi:hypothetical protein
VTGASLHGLGEVFGNVNKVGPTSYARFLASDTPELDKRQSVGAVEEFLIALNAESGVGPTTEKS